MKKRETSKEKQIEIVDPRYIKLHQYHAKLMTHCYGLGASNKKEDDSITNPIFAPFYDKLEPNWMKSIPGSVRMSAYEHLLYGSYGVVGHPAAHFRLYCAGYTGIATLTNIAIYIASKLFPKTYECITYCMLTAFNIPALAYICKVYYQGRQEEKAIKERIDHYKEKSIEYILREAHTQKIGYVEKHYTPDVEEIVVSEPGESSIERS